MTQFNQTEVLVNHFSDSAPRRWNLSVNRLIKNELFVPLMKLLNCTSLSPIILISFMFWFLSIGFGSEYFLKKNFGVNISDLRPYSHY